MKLNDKQRKEIFNLIETAKQTEYKNFNTTISNAVEELKNGIKTDEEAYNKIYKKVIKNEHHLIQRYANLNDIKSLQALAEVYTDKIITNAEFEKMDESIIKEVKKITGVL